MPDALRQNQTDRAQGDRGVASRRRRASDGSGRSRFYKHAAVAEDGAGFVVHLDGKPVKTPHRVRSWRCPRARSRKPLPANGRRRGEKLHLENMPLTRFANTGNELGAEHRAKAAERILAYGKSDLLCYRAEAPGGADPAPGGAVGSAARLGRRGALVRSWRSGHGIAFVEQPAAPSPHWKRRSCAA